MNVPTQYVEYHSKAWEDLLACHRVGYRAWGWITWEVFEMNGIQIAKMIYTTL